ncbi:MAG: hypothetical protein KDI15_13715 [Thiothrix sp.]|nr:hypothetical protein [Thiothrix sp.]HPE62419.1 Mor transcription activator family protein [Thiolinea sp.]
MRPNWPDTLTDIHELFITVLRNHGLPDPEADTLAQTLLIQFSDVFGGIQLYIPRGTTTKRELRDQIIFSKAGTVRVSALAMEYGLSMKQVYLIIRQQAERQGLPMPPAVHPSSAQHP